jgi:hypothetical protein
MSLDDIRQMLESQRTDVCVCRPGEEAYAKWYSQKHDLSSDSEEECLTATDNDSLGPTNERIRVDYHGQVHLYKP